MAVAVDLVNDCCCCLGQLLDTALSELRRLKKQCVMLHVDCDRAPAIALYKRNGFEVDAKEDDGYR